MKIASAFLAVLALQVSVGCDNGKEQKKAQEEQQAAAEKATKAQREADEKIASAKREADQVAAKASAARAETRASIQKDIDAADRKIAYLKERAGKATGAAKKNAEAALTETEKRREVVRGGMHKLETDTGAAWDQTKTEVDKGVDDLKRSVDSLETTVTGKAAH